MREKSSILPSQLNLTYSFESYKSLISRLVQVGKTSGEIQRADLVHFTALNAKRMHRIEKTCILSSDLKQAIGHVHEPLTWVIISEAWCGDAAQIIPVLSKIAALNSFIQLKIIFRDEHEAIMQHYLTDGGRSIPKLICLDKDFNELFVWGPRPAVIRQVLLDAKTEGISDYSMLVERLQIAYNMDRTQSIQEEIRVIISKLFLSMNSDKRVKK